MTPKNLEGDRCGIFGNPRARACVFVEQRVRYLEKSSFSNERGEACGELFRVVQGFAPFEDHPSLGSPCLGFDVEIEENLEVIGDEANLSDQERPLSLVIQVFQMV